MFVSMIASERIGIIALGVQRVPHIPCWCGATSYSEGASGGPLDDHGPTASTPDRPLYYPEHIVGWVDTAGRRTLLPLPPSGRSTLRCRICAYPWRAGRMPFPIPVAISIAIGGGGHFLHSSVLERHATPSFSAVAAGFGGRSWCSFALPLLFLRVGVVWHKPCSPRRS